MSSSLQRLTLTGVYQNAGASLQSKAKWLKTWPAADSPVQLDENVEFILPKNTRRAAAAEPYNEDGLDNEDVALPDVNDVPDDNKLFDALPPPDAEVATIQRLAPLAHVGVIREEVLGMFAEIRITLDGTKTAVDDIREDVNWARHVDNNNNQVLNRATNRLDGAAGALQAGATSLVDANQTWKQAEKKIQASQLDTDWAHWQELKAYEEEIRVLRAHRDHLDSSLMRYINDGDNTEKLAAFVNDRDKLEVMVKERNCKINPLEAHIEGLESEKRVREAEEGSRAEAAERRRKRKVLTIGFTQWRPRM
ncbi:hypothetical protein FN846DRAFT_906529 [Sphaerosporella brunnea]|uniref:Uncharacterized protein n=1 Tax=Sphaerosporella brunnea TaxID=1250544 RepID=A0A5J5EYI2_9PEZI|nr:hypothetical protein FN846DRAFT_906529 [Sphaerosporella brunnea]